MYAQQYRQPPKDYGGTAILPKEQTKQPGPAEREAPAPPRLLSSIGTDEILIAVIIFIVISGGWEKNALVIMALIFILL